MDNESEWTEVKSVYVKRNDKRISKIIGNRDDELEILSKYNTFIHDQNNNRMIFNSEIFKDVELNKYLESKYQLNKSFIHNRMAKLSQNSIKYLTKYFCDKTITTQDYKLICYCPELDIIQRIVGNLIYNLAFFKLTLKDEKIFKIVGIFKTSIENIPFSVVTYIENNLRKTNEKIYFFQNYYQVLLFLQYIELSINITTPNVVDFYPINFKNFNKDELHKYFTTYNKIW